MTALTEPKQCAARTVSCTHTMVIKKARLAATLIFGLLLSACSWSVTPRKTSAATSDFQEVESLIQQHRFAEAKTATLDLLQRHPTSVEGYNLLGIIQTDEQDYPAALASFQKALQLNPQSTKTHNNIANVYVAQQQPDLAEKEYRAVLRLDPSNSDANYNLGVLLVMKGSPSSAIEHLLRVHPMNTAARFNLVRAYFQTRRNADALRVAAELSEQNKNDVQVHFSLGVLLASEKEYKAAQLELERADALQPETFEIIYNLGQVSLRSSDYSKAQVILNRALKLNPESPETMYLLAQAYTNQSRPLDALDLLLRAHKLASENTDVIFLMAQVSMSQNYYEDAIPLLESGLRIAPKRADLLASLGESYFMAGKIEKAIEEFKKLVEIENSARSSALAALMRRSSTLNRGLNSTHTTVPAYSILDLSPSDKATPRVPKASFSKPCRPTRIFPTPCSNSQIYESPPKSFRRPRAC